MSHNGHTLLADKRAGVCLHITSLPGEYGIGEIGDSALAFADTLKRMGIGVWQFLPTGPTAYGDSPYQPLSSFAGNENLIDIADLVRRGLLTEEEVAPLKLLPHDQVDYGNLIAHKQALLAIAAQRFQTKATAAQKAEYDAFLETHNDAWLNDYALFRILKSMHGERPWPEWAPEFRNRDDAALRRLAETDAEKIEAIKTIQCLFFSQWNRFRSYANEQGVQLFGDMPIYIALDSSDAWANRGILRLDDAGRPACRRTTSAPTASCGATRCTPGIAMRLTASTGGWTAFARRRTSPTSCVSITSAASSRTGLYRRMPRRPKTVPGSLAPVMPCSTR